MSVTAGARLPPRLYHGVKPRGEVARHDVRLISVQTWPRIPNHLESRFWDPLGNLSNLGPRDTATSCSARHDQGRAAHEPESSSPVGACQLGCELLSQPSGANRVRHLPYQWAKP